MSDGHCNPWPAGEFSHSEASSVLAAGGLQEFFIPATKIQ